MQIKNLKQKLKHSTKGISPILAVLMMIVVAVAAGLVTYAWVMGYLDFTTSNVGKSIKIQSIGFDTEVRIYVQNVGEGTIELVIEDCLYVDGLNKICTADSTSLENGEFSTISWNGAPVLVDEQTILVRIITSDGTFDEVTWTYDI
jgi:flagellin-like protein